MNPTQPTAKPDAFAFTCLLPVWERDDPALLDLALSSIADSTLQPNHLLVCEDGPVGPALGKLLDGWSERLPLSRVTNAGERGLHFNLNNGLPHVTTPWLCRADADDWNHPERFARQVRRLVENPQIDVLGTEIEELGQDGRVLRKAMPQSHRDIMRTAVFRNPVNHMTAFVRTSALRAVGGYPLLNKKEDYGLWLRLLAKGARFENVPEPLVRATLGHDFYGRRAGLHNLSTELKLASMKLKVRGMNPVAIASALAARSVTLGGGRWIAGAIYANFLR